MQAESKWGGAFETLSEDLKRCSQVQKDFSNNFERYMKRYYNLFGEILPQLGAELPELQICLKLGQKYMPFHGDI